MPAPPEGGYLIIGDDTVISHCQLAAFNTSKVWFQRAIARKQENLAAWLDVVEVRFCALRHCMQQGMHSCMHVTASGTLETHCCNSTCLGARPVLPWFIASTPFDVHILLCRGAMMLRLTDSPAALCAQKNHSYQHWAYHREGVNTVNAIMGGFREGAMKNRFGQRIRAKLGTNLNEVPASPSAGLLCTV